MAAQLPIVAKYAPNLSEFIHTNKNGILVKKNSDFKDAIITTSAYYNVSPSIV